MFKTGHKVERRLRPRRLLVNPPVLVSVGESRTDLLYDLSEGGLSVYGLVPKRRDEVFPVDFDLPPGGGSIKASAGIAWTSTLKNRTGLRFLDVTDASRQRLADWMGTQYYAVRPTASDRKPAEQIPSRHAVDAGVTSVLQGTKHEEPAGPRLLPIPQRSVPEPEWWKLQQREIERPSRAGKPRLFIALVLSVAVLVLAAVLLRSHLSKMAPTGKATTSMTLPESPSKGSTAPAESLSATAPTQPATSPLDAPGFVLQVGAMRSEDNAVELSNSLRKKNFPGFVFKRGADRFYRVVVGPYADRASAMRVKDELQRENIEAFPRRWVPE